MRELVTLPNVITCGNLTAGFLALLALRDSFVLAAALIVLAAVLDILDGTIARSSAGESAFGANLDSLADLVSFGVVPAMALFLAALQSLPVAGIVACVGYLVCGAWRLARFPLLKNGRCFLGLPIPLAGVVVMLLAPWGPPPVLTLLATVVLSALMVSTVPFPTLASACRGTVRLASRSTRRGARR